MLYGRCDVERTNQPLTNEAARKLMALDVQDTSVGAELGVCEHWVGVPGDTEVRQ